MHRRDNNGSVECDDDVRSLCEYTIYYYYGLIVVMMESIVKWVNKGRMDPCNMYTEKANPVIDYVVYTIRTLSCPLSLLKLANQL